MLGCKILLEFLYVQFVIKEDETRTKCFNQLGKYLNLISVSHPLNHKYLTVWKNYMQLRDVQMRKETAAWKNWL